MSPEHFTADTVVPAKADKRMVAALQALVVYEQAVGRLSLVSETSLRPDNLYVVEIRRHWERLWNTPGARELWRMAHGNPRKP